MQSNISGDKILKIKINGDFEISDSLHFKGGTSVFNPNNDDTHFPGTDGKNYIRGDTIVQGNTEIKGDTNILGVLKVKGRDLLKNIDDLRTSVSGLGKKVENIDKSLDNYPLFTLAKLGKSCPDGYKHVTNRDECKKFVDFRTHHALDQYAHEYGDFNRTAWNHHAYGCFMVNSKTGRVHFNISNHSKQKPYHNELMVCKRI